MLKEEFSQILSTLIKKVYILEPKSLESTHALLSQLVLFTDLFQRAQETLKIMLQKREKLSSQPLKKCVT